MRISIAAGPLAAFALSLITPPAFIGFQSWLNTFGPVETVTFAGTMKSFLAGSAFPIL